MNEHALFNSIGWGLAALQLTIVVVLYVRGYRALAQHPEQRPDWRRQAAFWGSLLVFTIPHFWLRRYGSELLVFRTLQHLLLMGLSPALFFVADPLPLLWQGLPAAVQTRIQHWFASDRTPLTVVKAIFGRGPAWLFYVAVAWLWYDPTLHELGRTDPLVHLIELFSLNLAASVYWWHITSAAPRLHEPLPQVPQVLYAFTGAWPVKIIGAALIFSSDIQFVYPADVLARWGVSAITNQVWGGILIWGFGGIAYTTMAAILLRRWMAVEDNKPPLLIDQILTDEKMLAPGVRRYR